jgi:serine/threonine protein kinase
MIASGTVFGPYRIVEKIGAGGMGDVYRALDTRLEREVALKLISGSFLISDSGAGSPSPSGTPHSRVQLSHERFLREARAAATLNHPNICAIHDVGEQDGQPTWSWSYCAGKPSSFISPTIASLHRKY